MLKIKLARTGKKNERHYRIVVVEDRSKLTGSNVAVIGHFHPLRPKTAADRLVVDMAQMKEWMTKGAQPTPTLRKLVKLS